MSIHVIYINKSNNLEHVLKQYNKQTHVNKKLTIFDNINTEKPIGLDSSITYINNEKKLSDTFQQNSANVIQWNKEIIQLSEKMNKIDQNVTGLEKISNAKKPANDGSEQDDKKFDAMVKKAKDDIKALMAEKEVHQKDKKNWEEKVVALKKENNELVDKISDNRKKGISLNDAKDIVVSQDVSDCYAFMEDNVYYRANHLEKMVKDLTQFDVICTKDLLMYDTYTANLLLRSTKKNINTINMAFTKAFGASHNLDTPDEWKNTASLGYSTSFIDSSFEFYHYMHKDFEQFEIRYVYNKKIILSVYGYN